MGAHSPIPPSSAKIWGAPGGCTGWVMVNAMYPDNEKSEPALDGTACHALSEVMISGICTLRPGDTIEDRIITEEMYDAAMLYADVIRDKMRETGIMGGELLGIEEHLSAPSIHALSHGTVDAFIYDKKRNHIYMYDLKFGFGVVEVFENWQMINYLAALIDRFAINGLTDQDTKVTFCIVQPRAYHRDGPVRYWHTMASELRAHIGILRNNARVAMSDEATTHPGAHCKYCRGKLSCEALINSGLQAVDMSGDTMPLNLRDEDVSTLYTMYKRGLEQLEYIVAALEEDIKARIRGGALVPGYSLVPTRGRRSWQGDEAEIAATLAALDYDITTKAVLTPAQAQKAGVPKEVVEQFSEHLSGLAIKKDDNNRARNVFSRKV